VHSFGNGAEGGLAALVRPGSGRRLIIPMVCETERRLQPAAETKNRSNERLSKNNPLRFNYLEIETAERFWYFFHGQ
jgi:hypothetical protein